MTTDAELRSLLLDCLKLWEIQGTIVAGDDGLIVASGETTVTIRRGLAPTRWFVIHGQRARPVPSVVALLSAIRRALGIPPGVRARVGAGAAPQ